MLRLIAWLLAFNNVRFSSTFKNPIIKKSGLRIRLPWPLIADAGYGFQAEGEQSDYRIC